jgi:hypothetical protein
MLPVLAVAPAAGCLGKLHPVPPPTPEELHACAAVPQPCRNHVYVFLVHGLDPLDYANLTGVREHLNALGYIKTYQGQLYHGCHFAREIRRLHADDPDARFALVGFSLGANVARDIANAVADDGIHIDLLVYLGGNTLDNDPEDRPANVGKVVNILARGWVWNGADIADAENVEYTDVYHFGSPTHPHTLEVLSRELLAAAGNVPIVVSKPAPAVPEQAPAPRPADDEAGDDWNFLRPSAGIPDATDRRAPIAYPANAPAGDKALPAEKGGAVTPAPIRQVSR